MIWMLMNFFQRKLANKNPVFNFVADHKENLGNVSELVMSNFKNVNH